MEEQKELDLIDISRPKLTASGIQVTKNFANDIKTKQVKRKIKKNPNQVVKKPVGFLGKLKEKIRTAKVNRDIKKNIMVLKEKYQSVYEDYLKIEKLKDMETTIMGQEQKSRIDALINKLYNGKKESIDYLDYVINELDNYNDMYPNIKDEMVYQTIISLPRELENIDIDKLEKELKDKVAEYKEEDITALETLIGNINNTRNNGRSR